jgi:DNA-binding MarR family transcriptional regulator
VSQSIRYYLSPVGIRTDTDKTKPHQPATCLGFFFFIMYLIQTTPTQVLKAPAKYQRMAIEIVNDDKLNPRMMALYCLISGYCETNEGRCFATNAQLCKDLNVHKSNLCRSLSVLTERGYIHIERDPKFTTFRDIYITDENLSKYYKTGKI